MKFSIPGSFLFLAGDIADYSIFGIRMPSESDKRIAHEMSMILVKRSHLMQWLEILNLDLCVRCFKKTKMGIWRQSAGLKIFA